MCVCMCVCVYNRERETIDVRRRCRCYSEFHVIQQTIISQHWEWEGEGVVKYKTGEKYQSDQERHVKVGTTNRKLGGARDYYLSAS